MNITENFTLEELVYSQTAEEMGIDNTPSAEIITKLTALCEQILQPVRDKYGKSIIITSGYRCQELNKLVKGASSSQHKLGEAADIVHKRGDYFENKKLFELIKGMIQSGEIVVGQLINEHNFQWIHVSLPTPNHRNEIFSIK